MIEIIKYEPKHLEQIELKENFMQGECPKTVLTTAFTLMRGDKIIAIIGGFPFVPGVVHFWSLVSKHALKCLKWYEVNEKPRRIQFEVRASYEMGCRWAEALGLQREGTLRRWGADGADYYLYARVNPWLG